MKMECIACSFLVWIHYRDVIVALAELIDRTGADVLVGVDIADAVIGVTVIDFGDLMARIEGLGDWQDAIRLVVVLNCLADLLLLTFA